MRPWLALVLTLAVVIVPVAGSEAASGPFDPAASTVRVAGEACGEPIRGVGVVVDTDLVLTNAHVVAGVDDLEVGSRSARVVGFDPERDLALVAVAGLDRPAVAVGRPQRSGDVGSLVAIDVTDQLVRHAYEVRRWIWANGDDIYGTDGARRRADEVAVVFAPGWSGSGLFADDGRLVAIAFAQSLRRPGTAYAVSASEIQAFLTDPAIDRPSVDPSRCLYPGASR